MTAGRLGAAAFERLLTSSGLTALRTVHVAPATRRTIRHTAFVEETYDVGQRFAVPVEHHVSRFPRRTHEVRNSAAIMFTLGCGVRQVTHLALFASALDEEPLAYVPCTRPYELNHGDVATFDVGAIRWGFNDEVS